MERFRLFISQIVTCIVVGVLVIRFCRGVIVNTGFINRFYSYQINSVSVTLLIGLLVIAILAVKLILWLIRRPLTEKEIEELEMGTIENIPEGK